MSSNPYVGEIRMFAGNFAPANWLLCEGQLVSISENETLFNLIGTTYGGDGQETFGLPDLRGRIPIHEGAGHTLGELSGSEAITLTVAQLAAHSHPPIASRAASSQTTPVNNVTADTTLAGAQIYAPLSSPVALPAAAVSIAGASQPHENRMPYLGINFIISQFGEFPPHN